MRNYLPFIGSDLATQWHPTRNGTSTPDKFRVGSNKKVWWLCPEGHEWEAIIQSRALKSNGCPFCSGRRVSSTNCFSKLNYFRRGLYWLLNETSPEDGGSDVSRTNSGLVDPPTATERGFKLPSRRVIQEMVFVNWLSGHLPSHPTSGLRLRDSEVA